MVGANDDWNLVEVARFDDEPRIFGDEWITREVIDNCNIGLEGEVIDQGKLNQVQRDPIWRNFAALSIF